MAKVKCPKCKRVGTYNEKFSQCSACRFGYPAEVPRTIADHEALAEKSSTVGFYDPDKPVERVPNLELVEGEPCPLCLKPVGRSASRLQREYRERKKQ